MFHLPAFAPLVALVTHMPSKRCPQFSPRWRSLLGKELAPDGRAPKQGITKGDGVLPLLGRQKHRQEYGSGVLTEVARTPLD